MRNKTEETAFLWLQKEFVFKPSNGLPFSLYLLEISAICETTAVFQTPIIRKIQ